MKSKEKVNRNSPVFLSKGLLGEFSKVGASGGFDVKGVEGGGLLGVDCLPMPKGQVGTVGVNDVGMRLGSSGRFSSSLESGWAEKPLWVLWQEMSNGEMSCFWIGGTDGHS